MHTNQIWLRYDLRSPPFGTSNRDLCRIVLEQLAWADTRGFDAAQLPEHHGSEDGYDPSPMLFGAAIAARTSNLRIHPSAVLLPLHDPVRVAEDIALLDNISDGRVDVTVGIGYVPSEFVMYGVAMSQRAKLMDSKLAVLRRALAGENFVWEGRQIHVTPRPVQQPHPPIYVGGAVPASARRAAKLGDGFMPTMMTPQLSQTYIDACTELGKAPGPIIDVVSGPQFIHVSEDPEAAWARIAPHALYETNMYFKWLQKTATAGPFEAIADASALRQSGRYRVVTPDECVALVESRWRENAVLMMNPMLAGLDAELAWSSLELFASKVMPRLKKIG